MSERLTSHAIEETAADWASRFDRAPLTSEEQSTLNAWLAADIRHEGAYIRALAVLSQLERAQALGPAFDASDFAPTAASVGDADANWRAPSAHRRHVLIWSAVGAAAAAASGALIGFQLLAKRIPVSTRRGEVRLYPLDDGSNVTLNTDSKIVVEFSKTARMVRLLAGEALFDVAKDAARPFTVIAGDTRVTAVGTSFTVCSLADRPVEVLVRQGVVDVHRQGARTPPVRLAANNRAVSAGDAAIEASAVVPAQLNRELAWREGMLSFEDMRLDRAVNEFARYSDTRIIVDDPAIAAETITGLFPASDPAGFARAVATTLELRAETTPDGVKLHR